MSGFGENGTTELLNLSFDEVIEELSDFKGYFTDEENRKKLVNWLHEDYSIPKAASRVAIKSDTIF